MRTRKFQPLIAVVCAMLLGIMSFIPAIPVYASGDPTAPKELAYVAGDDYSVKPIPAENPYEYKNMDQIENYYYYNAGSSDVKVNATWKGVVFDSKTSTFTLKNVNAPMLELRIDGADSFDYHFVLEGTNKIGNINIFGGKSVSFEGTGTLEVNAPVTGTQYFVHAQRSNDLKNESPFDCALQFTAQTDQVPSVVIKDKATLKLYAGEVIAGSSSSGSEVKCSARFLISGSHKDVANKIFSCDGTIDPALKMKEEVVDSSVKSVKRYESTKDYYGEVTIPAANIFTVSGNDLLYIAYETDEYYYQSNPFLVRTLSKTGNNWYVGEDVDQLTGEEFSAYTNADTTKLNQLFPNGIKAYTVLYNCYPSEFKKQNETYVLYSDYSYDGHIADVIGNVDHSNNKWYLAKVNASGSVVLFQSPVLRSEFPSYADSLTMAATLSEEGYTYETVLDYESINTYCYLINPVQTFVAGTKPANTDPGTGNNDKKDEDNKTTDPGKDDQKTEAPKSGDTVQKDNGDFKLSEDKSGNMTAEFSSNEKTDGQKSVTIPETVEVNGKEVPVTAIADNAFSGNKTLTTLKFKGKNLQKVGKNAFSKCTNLKSAVLPDSVTEIGKGAFDGDKKISKITLNGNTLKKVGKNAFRGIKKNAKITIKAKNDKVFKQVVKKIKKAGNKKLKFKFKKSKK